jgi:uncharacterized membrane protein YgcG
MKRFLQLAVALIFLGATANTFASDIPPLKGRVNDNAGLMTADEQSKLATILRELEDKTTAQVVILTVDAIPGGETLGKFKNAVFHAWGLGQKGKDNGVLIVHVTDGDHYGIEIGYGLEPVLPDAVAGDIIRQQLRPHADPKHGTHDFFGAFSAAVKVIGDRIVAEEEANKSPSVNPEKPMSRVVVFMIVFLVMIVIIVVMIIILGSTKTSTDEEEPVRDPELLSRRRGSRRRLDYDRSRAADDDDSSSSLGSVVGTASASDKDDDDTGGDKSDDKSDANDDNDITPGGGDSGGGGAED